jgi:hypothetical protein
LSLRSAQRDGGETTGRKDKRRHDPEGVAEWLPYAIAPDSGKLVTLVIISKPRTTVGDVPPGGGSHVVVLFDKLFDYDTVESMETNVSTLLREFPKVRRAALAGERVIVHTREGDLWITAAQEEGQPLLGALRGVVEETADDLDQPTSGEQEWGPSL